MAIKKTCAHARGLVGEARRRAWSRCGCSWYADVCVAGNRQVVNVGTDRTAALAEYHRLAGEVLSGRALVVPRQHGGRDLSFGAACERWLERVETEGGRPSTMATYRSRAVRLRDYFGDGPLTTIQPGDLEDFVTETRKVRSANYTRDCYTMLLAILRLAEADGLVDRAPIPKRPLRLRREEREALTRARVEAVIPRIDEPFRQLAELSLLTSMRIGEMLGLEAGDLEGRTLRIERTMYKSGRIGPPKTESSRRGVKLSADAHAILAAACLARPVGRIFPYSYHVANDRLRKALVAAGLYKRGRSWHIFRHANGDLRDEAGHSLRSQSAQMGHGNNLAQTMRYGSAGDVDADALDRVRHGLSAA